MFSQLYEQLKGEDIFKPKSMEEVIQDIISGPGVIKNDDGSYDVEGSVNLTDLDLTKIPIKFRYVGEHFDCGYNKLTSLEDAPKEVGWDFYCSGNDLTTLKGIGEVKGEIYCGGNPVSEKELLKTIGR